MKKIILILCFCLLSFPLLGYAKYCPSCLDTFQGQTIYGRTKLLYQWLIKAMNPKYPLEKQNIKYLFNKNVTIKVNGQLIAKGYDGIYRYLVDVRKHRPLQEDKLQQILIDKNHACIAYQIIFKRKGHRYRLLVIAMLTFKNHKVTHSWIVSHAIKLT